MWVLKKPGENEEELKKAAKKAAIAAFFIFIGLGFFAAKTGYNFPDATLPGPWGEVIQHFPFLFFSALVISILVYFKAISNKRNKNTRLLVCLKCGESKINDGQYTCKCGENMVDLNQAQWE